ncbi:MAG TPA: hypothetical protein EYN97_01890 [Candidatus Lambdaproteobacteria bacterium]|nr:hypothetical protein [SAR324 cluster bacterium]HIA56186.1 hypothetical protein [Candidatus Lambdaproteobacteria bacterium]HIB94738.1 hypothetical protein [Candidatus Lambdaproteobacteria bacterium]HIO83559.1 hypothetical protein [Deltaproteobacteria bacterium]
MKTGLPEKTPAVSENLRSPEKVMCLSRMGSSFQTRLSFMRSLTRRISREKWKFEQFRFEVDENGYGISVFGVHTPERTYSLIVFTNEIAPEKRTDRVVAEVWDASFNLFDGIPTESDIKRLSGNTPKQEAGRFSPSELVLARANKSLRLFEHVVSSLAQGRQPDIELLVSVGYLMRTTAVYGNGKFGCADREKISNRDETRGSFQVELLTVYLFRWFTIELVEYIARRRGGQNTVRLKPEISKFLGIGNATGLGMAPFLIKHPVLIHNWVLARETALSRVICLESHSPETLSIFRKNLLQATRHICEWNVDDEKQTARIVKTREELRLLSKWISDEEHLKQPFLWKKILGFAESKFSLEGQELTVSLLLEPHGELVDDLAEDLQTSTETELDPVMNLKQLRELLEKSFSWALGIDFDDPEKQRRFWYYSEEKLEPRFGDRYVDPGAEQEMPLAVGRDVFMLSKILKTISASTAVGAFVQTHPEFRNIVRRVQTVVHYPYAEIRDNLVDAEMRPIDLLRFKLAFFGASKFDPKSELWTRITLFQGAPLPEQFAANESDEWAFPASPRSEAA